MATTETAKNGQGRKPERPQTETATDRTDHKLERPQTETASDQNSHKPKWHKPERPHEIISKHNAGHMHTALSQALRVN